MKENNFCEYLIEILSSLKESTLFEEKRGREMERKLKRKLVRQQEAAKWVLEGDVDYLRTKLKEKKKGETKEKGEEEEEEEEEIDPFGGMVLVGGNSPEGLVPLFFLAVVCAQKEGGEKRREIVRMMIEKGEREEREGRGRRGGGWREVRAVGFDVLGFALALWRPKENLGEGLREVLGGEGRGEGEGEGGEEEIPLELYTMLLEGVGGGGEEKGEEDGEEEERGGIHPDSSGYQQGDEKWPLLWMAISGEHRFRGMVVGPKGRVLVKLVELLLCYGADPYVKVKVVGGGGGRGCVELVGREVRRMGREVGEVGGERERVDWETVLVLLETGRPPLIKG